jgi:hypothetical protein
MFIFYYLLFYDKVNFHRVNNINFVTIQFKDSVYSMVSDRKVIKYTSQCLKSPI